MKRIAGILLLLAAPALALAAGREVAGVVMPETVPAAGKTLHLNGMGLRTKFIFKVYVAGLYLENPTRDAGAAISSEQVKRVDLHLLRSLDGAKITEAIEEGFQKNSHAQMSSLKARLDQLGAMIPDVRERDRITLTYIPQKGTVVTVKGAEKGTIAGKDFADALFSVWLGPHPVQADLKKAMLGG